MLFPAYPEMVFFAAELRKLPKWNVRPLLWAFKEKITGAPSGQASYVAVDKYGSRFQIGQPWILEGFLDHCHLPDTQIPSSNWTYWKSLVG